MIKDNNFLKVYLTAVLFTITVFGTCYLAYFLGPLNTVVAVCMVALALFSVEIYKTLSKYDK